MEKASKKLDPIHPGEILSEEFMRPLGLSQNKLAGDIDVPVFRVNAIVRGKRGISPDTALRLGRYFRTSPEFWLNLQMRHDLEIAERERGEEIARRVRASEAA